MFKYKTVSTIVVDCSDYGFGPFEVLVVPNTQLTEAEGRSYNTYYLRHPEYGPVMDMGEWGCGSVEEVAESAHRNAIDFIPAYIKEVIDCDDQD